MAIKDTIIYQVRLTQPERDALRRLAAETGRTRANVVRSLILLAASDNSYRRALGELPQPERELNA